MEGNLSPKRLNDIAINMALRIEDPPCGAELGFSIASIP
jgi:hypothetical protein